MKICVRSFGYVVVRMRRVWCMAINFACSIFWSHGSLSAILRFLKGLYIPYHVFFSFPMLLGYFFGWYKRPVRVVTILRLVFEG